MRLDLSGRGSRALSALLVGAVYALRFVEGEHLLALVAGVVGVLLAEDVVGVAVGELVELGSSGGVSMDRLGEYEY